MIALNFADLPAAEPYITPVDFAMNDRRDVKWDFFEGTMGQTAAADLSSWERGFFEQQHMHAKLGEVESCHSPRWSCSDNDHIIMIHGILRYWTFIFLLYWQSTVNWNK